MQIRSPLIEVNIHGGVVVDGHGFQGHIDVSQSNVDAHFAHEFLIGKGAVGTGHFGLCNVPRASIIAN